MADVSIVGYAVTNSGSQIPLRVDSKAEGTEHTVTTDTNLTTTAQDIGSYMPGATISALEIFCPNGIGYAYILRQGVILAWASVQTTGVNSRQQMLSTPVQLRPGDQVRAFPKTAVSRTVALCVTTNRGVSRIFTGTAASGTVQLTDLQDSSNSIGDTLQGQVVTQAILTVGGTQAMMPVSSGGAWIRNASGQLAGIVPASNPAHIEGLISMVNIPIQLNWTASIVCAA